MEWQYSRRVLSIQQSFCGPVSGTKDTGVKETLRGCHGPKSDAGVLDFTSRVGGPLRDETITWVPRDEEAGMTS